MFFSADKRANATPGSFGHWKLVSNIENVLIIRGYEICTVRACFEFRKTLDVYETTERNQHLENLRIMLEFGDKLKVGRRSEAMESWMRKPANEQALKVWMEFLTAHQEDDPARILRSLKG